MGNGTDYLSRPVPQWNSPNQISEFDEIGHSVCNGLPDMPLDRQYVSWGAHEVQNRSEEGSVYDARAPRDDLGAGWEPQRHAFRSRSRSRSSSSNGPRAVYSAPDAPGDQNSEELDLFAERALWRPTRRPTARTIPNVGASHPRRDLGDSYGPRVRLSSALSQVALDFDDSPPALSAKPLFTDDRQPIAQQRAIEGDRRRMQTIVVEERHLEERHFEGGFRGRKGRQEEEASLARERRAERPRADRIRLIAGEADRSSNGVEATERHRLEREAEARREVEEVTEGQRLERERMEREERWEREEAERIRWLLSEQQPMEDSRLAQIGEEMRMEFRNQKAELDIVAAAAQLEAEETHVRELQEQRDTVSGNLIAEETQGPSELLPPIPALPGRRATMGHTERLSGWGSLQTPRKSGILPLSIL